MKVSSIIVLFVLLVGVFFTVAYCTRQPSASSKKAQKSSMKNKNNKTTTSTTGDATNANAATQDTNSPFKTQQMTYERVSFAYRKKLPIIKGLLKQQNINSLNIELFVRAMKQERLLEVWARERGTKKFKLIFFFF